MTTFTAWKFESVDGAQRAYEVLEAAEADGIVTVVDAAVITWPEGESHPALHHDQKSAKRGAGWGALWGLLVGALFFIPFVGAAAGAAVGAAGNALKAAGLTPDQLDMLREQVTPGSSALMLVTEDADLDRLGERFHGTFRNLLATNLTEAERQTLTETFGG